MTLLSLTRANILGAAQAQYSISPWDIPVIFIVSERQTASILAT